MRAPTGVLATIGVATRRRVAAEKAALPEAELRRQALAAPAPRPFAAALGAPGAPGPGRRAVIAEVKLASPSEGALGKGLDPVALAREYAANGAAAISVLTEPEFFAGSLKNLRDIRRAVEVPLLMKDFILDDYQLLQARAFGADCALLIVALIGPAETRRLLLAARSLGLEALVEVHDQPELDQALAAGAGLIGVNNRDLKTLAVDLGVSRRLAAAARGSGAALVCESGIRSRAELDELAALGYSGFLVGTHLIKSGRPGAALADLLGGRPS